MNAKRILLNVLDYLKWQIENDKCTMSEIRSISDAITEGVSVQATEKDIAELFGQEHTAVSSALSRCFFPKSKRPVRRVMYDFGHFIKHMPKTWRNRHDRTD